MCLHHWWTCDSCYWYLFVKDLTGELVIHIVLNITSGRLINAFCTCITGGLVIMLCVLTSLLDFLFTLFASTYVFTEHK